MKKILFIAFLHLIAYRVNTVAQTQVIINDTSKQWLMVDTTYVTYKLYSENLPQDSIMGFDMKYWASSAAFVAKAQEIRLKSDSSATYYFQRSVNWQDLNADSLTNFVNRRLREIYGAANVIE